MQLEQPLRNKEILRLETSPHIVNIVTFSENLNTFLMWLTQECSVAKS